MMGRAVLKEIELKEAYLNNHGKLIIFDHDHYMRLRHPVDYSNAVLLTFDRGAIADGIFSLFLLNDLLNELTLSLSHSLNYTFICSLRYSLSLLLSLSL